MSDQGEGRTARAENAQRLLTGVPFRLEVAAKQLGRQSGVYAWWAASSVFPDLPGLPNPHVQGLRMLYLGKATTLRGRILRTHLRRSDQSTLRRTLAGLLASEDHRAAWTIPVDEARLTAWMYDNLTLTWAEDAEPHSVEATLVQRLHPPLNVSGVDPRDVQPAVLDAKARYEAANPE